MKGLERFLLILFSIIVIICSVGVVLVSTELINLTSLFETVQNLLIANKMVGLVAGGIFALLGLIGMFSYSESSEEARGGLAIKGERGTTYITKDTFENIILGVTRGYAELRNTKVDMTVTESGIIANVHTLILPDTVVPTLTAKLQENIKSSVLKQTTVEIKEVNIKIRGVYLEPQKR